MNEPKDEQQQNALFDLINFSVTGKIGLAFFLAFFILGYPAVISLFLGVVGGLASGWLAVAWKMPLERDSTTLLTKLEDMSISAFGEERTKAETWREAKRGKKHPWSSDAAVAGWRKLINRVDEDIPPGQRSEQLSAKENELRDRLDRDPRPEPSDSRERPEQEKRDEQK